MEFFDIVFPLNIGLLTYSCDDKYAHEIKSGIMVSAQIKKRIMKGIVIGKSQRIPSGDIKAIMEVHDDFLLSVQMIKLLRWMSEYYMSEAGLVLKNMLPKEVFKKIKTRKKKNLHQFISPPFNREDYEEQIRSNDLESILDSLRKNEYSTFLLCAPSSSYEYSFLFKIIEEIHNAIILVPEVSVVNTLYPFLYKRFAERICIFHSGLSSGRRTEVIERIKSGFSDIILGTRSAIFLPLRKVSLIAVLQEHSRSYKQDCMPSYNGRDVAVMRGFLEKATVLLSSICPSIESLFNCRLKKYNLIEPTDRKKKPKIKLLDMKHDRLIKSYLSKSVIDIAARYVHNNKKVVFIINRRGYSTLLQCLDCNYIEECPICKMPLIFHKQDMSMRCHYCGYIKYSVPVTCKRCHGYNLEMLGAGTQRIQEVIEEILGIKTIRFDSDRVRTKDDIGKLEDEMFYDENKIVIGTKLMTQKTGFLKEISMAIFLNSDISLNIPDFRSAERTYQDISSITDKIDNNGIIFIQTRMPQHYLYKYLKRYDYQGFFYEELERRRPLNYPPYARLILIKVTSKRVLSKELSEEISNLQRDIQDVEILGPTVSKNKKGENEFKLLLKSSVRMRLHAAARALIKVFKDSKNLKIGVDVDPIEI